MATSKLLSCEVYRKHAKSTEYIRKVYVTMLPYLADYNFWHFSC